MNIVNEHGFRQDGRRFEQIRNINCKLGVNRNADGSAYLEQGNTRILCAVYGPHEGMRRNRVSEDSCTVSVNISMSAFSAMERINRTRGDRKTSAMSRMLEKAFESVIITTLYPRAQIDIFCEILQEDGSRLSSCINAASLALVDAGISMRGVITSVTSSCVDGKPVMDVSSREENDTIPRIVVASLSGGDEIVLVELEKNVHVDDMESLLGKTMHACSAIHSCLHSALQSHLSHTNALV